MNCMLKTAYHQIAMSCAINRCAINGVSGKMAPPDRSIDRSIARSIARAIVFSLARSLDKFSRNSSRRCDRDGAKIVKIGAILAIFRPFEVGVEKITCRQDYRDVIILY